MIEDCGGLGRYQTTENDEWRGIEAYNVETEEFRCFELCSPTNLEAWE